MTTIEQPVQAPVPLLAGEVLAVPATAGLLRNTVLAFAASHGLASGAALGDIALAITEAVSNVVVHAYPYAAPGPLRFAVDVEDGDLEIMITDDGLGFRAGDGDGTGLGLRTIAAVSADFAIRQRRAGGTEIWMRFLLDDGEPGRATSPPAARTTW